MSGLLRRATVARGIVMLLAVGAFNAPLAAQLPPPLPPDATTLAKIDPLLIDLIADSTGANDVIVRAQDSASVANVAALIAPLGGTVGRTLAILDGFVATLPNASVLTLAGNPLVQRVSLDRVMLGLVERTSATIGATSVRQELGYDGAGIGVAVIDSGITAWHDDLEDTDHPGTQRVDRFVDFVSGQSTASDDYGHGTHVAGIIAGNGHDSSGARTGIAPAARLTVLKVLDGMGRGTISNLIAALDYVVAHKSELNIRVVNISVGAGVYESVQTDPLTQAAKRVVDQGIVVVASAGNHGRDANGVVQHGAISAPGNAPWVITVGASSHQGTVDRSDDIVASFSSLGPTALDHAAKPDLVAPGHGIYSLSNPASTMYQTYAQFLLPGTVQAPELPYLSLSGTSQAAPVVTGTVALMLQANPALTPNAVKAILQYTAEAHAGVSLLAQGAGFLDARGAVDLARTFNDAPETRPAPPSTWSRWIIWGNDSLQGGDLNSASAAWSVNVTWGSPAIAWGVDPAAHMNVVWGLSCSGTNCEGRLWATSDDDTVVWGNSDDADTVVWGNSEDDTVVWGNNENDTIVWGNSGEDPGCAPVIWPQG